MIRAIHASGLGIATVGVLLSAAAPIFAASQEEWTTITNELLRPGAGLIDFRFGAGLPPPIEYDSAQLGRITVAVDSSGAIRQWRAEIAGLFTSVECTGTTPDDGWGKAQLGSVSPGVSMNKGACKLARFHAASDVAGDFEIILADDPWVCGRPVDCDVLPPPAEPIDDATTARTDAIAATKPGTTVQGVNVAWLDPVGVVNGALFSCSYSWGYVAVTGCGTADGGLVAVATMPGGTASSNFVSVANPDGGHATCRTKFWDPYGTPKISAGPTAVDNPLYNKPAQPQQLTPWACVSVPKVP